MNNNASSLLTSVGLAARARKVTFGTELTCEAADRGIAKLVLLSKEASQNTLKKVKRCCAENNVCLYITDVDAATLAHAVGKSKPIMTVGITDENFKILVQRNLAKVADTTAFLQTFSESEV